MSSRLDQPALFETPDWEPAKDKALKPLPYPIWTKNKARLVERYLYYFVQITKHGTYIDGFAGPQNPDEPEMWAAKLVLESEPRWLRHFYLFDADAKQIERLRELRRAQPATRPKEPRRDITICQGDFNTEVGKLLKSGCITSREATFCLLDQRTFECHWRTLETLAAHKSGLKIELFYFLPVKWLKRAISALTKNRKQLDLWWGRKDFESIRKLRSFDLAQNAANRFRTDLGYSSAKAWPIYEKQDSGNVMYYMIHATDHLEAAALMHRAYSRAVTPKEPATQLMLELGYPPRCSL